MYSTRWAGTFGKRHLRPRQLGWKADASDAGFVCHLSGTSELRAARASSKLIGAAALYDYVVYEGRPCEPTGAPAELKTTAVDAGYWSVDGNRVRFRSTGLFGLGEYSATPRLPGSNAGVGPLLEFSAGGHTFTWRRVRGYGNSYGSVWVSALDEQGRFANGVRLEFRESDGIVSGGVTNNDRAFGTGVLLGISVTIHTRLPAGYSYAPGQNNPVTLVAGPTNVVTIRVTRQEPAG